MQNEPPRNSRSEYHFEYGGEEDPKFVVRERGLSLAAVEAIEDGVYLFLLRSLAEKRDTWSSEVVAY